MKINFGRCPICGSNLQATTQYSATKTRSINSNNGKISRKASKISIGVADMESISCSSCSWMICNTQYNYFTYWFDVEYYKFYFGSDILSDYPRITYNKEDLDCPIPLSMIY